MGSFDRFVVVALLLVTYPRLHACPHTPCLIVSIMYLSLALLLCLMFAPLAVAQTDDDLAQINKVIQQYYDGVTKGDYTILETIFNEHWHMKNLREADGKELLVEDKQTFIQRVMGRPLPGYGDDRQINSIDVAYGRLALVRVDKPSTRTTTFFTLFKLEGRWLIVNKLWADATTAVE